MFLIFFVGFILMLLINNTKIEKFTELTNQKYIITFKPYTDKPVNNNLLFYINRNNKQINRLYSQIEKLNNKIIKIGLQVNNKYKKFSNSNNTVNHSVSKLNSI